MVENAGPGPQHLMAFGAIIQWFARYEFLMQAAMAGILGADLGSVVVVTAGLSYNGKRDALLSLTNLTDLAPEKGRQIKAHLDSMHKHSALRNAIAHSIWVPGSRDNAVKPMRIITKGGVGKTIGHDEGETDHTPEELLQAVSEIAVLYREFADYLISARIVPDIEQMSSAQG